MPRRQWVGSEKAIRRALGQKLRDFTLLAHRTLALVDESLTIVRSAATDPMSLATQVHVRLLARAAADLRVVNIAATSGYSMQALTLMAGIYEISHTVAYIGQNPDRAKLWEDHTSEERSYPPARSRPAAVKATLQAALPHITDEAELQKMVDAQEHLYRMACMAKHANPKVLRGHGVTLAGDTMKVWFGPFVDDASTKQARFALLHSSRMILGAVLLFCNPLLQTNDKAYRKLSTRAAPAVSLLAKIMQGKISDGLGAA